MTFVPMLFDDITQVLVNWITGNGAVTPLAPNLDLSEGSIERSHLEALAVQLESFEARTARAILDAITNSCFHAFGFDQLPSVPSTGAVVFSAFTAPSEDIVIPAGFRLVSSSGQVFDTLANATLSAGNTVTSPVFVQAETSGSAGNVAANSLTTMVSPLVGVDLVTNPQPTMGGGDPESDDSRSQRFTSYIQTLQRGTNESLEYAVTTGTAASLARVIEPFDLSPLPQNMAYAGVVWLFCYDGSTGGLTDASKSQIAQVINGYLDQAGQTVPGWKAAGVQVTVLPAQVVTVDIRGAVTLLPSGGGRWDQIQANLLAATNTYFGNLRIGDSVCYQTLAAALNTCDPDIVEVILQMWVDNANGQGLPAPGLPPAVIPLAQDLNPLDPTLNPAAINNTYAAGSLCVLNQVTQLGSAPAYPQWVLS